MYRNGISVLKAREQLEQIRVACTPHMKDDKRERLSNDLSKAGYPDAFEQHEIDHVEMARLLNG